uniref:Uncharacterized protein n=1 Tax=Oryza brachyantha TaxID=4533 RepID=J3KW55_ORYBR
MAPKVAFLFLVRAQLPLRPLWERFFAGHRKELYSIYVHSDPPYAAPMPTDSVFYGRMIPSQKTSWGDANMVEAERRLLANALLDLSNERFALLSESCIPIFDFPTVHAHLTDSNDSFVDCFRNAGALARYRPALFAPHNITAAQWRKGSQSRSSSRWTAPSPWRSPHPRTHGTGDVTDELFAKMRSAAANCTSLPSTGWRPRSPHPRTHGTGDVTDELFAKMRSAAANCTYNGAANNMCFVFARKFSPDALAPLLDLAPKVMGFR